MNGFQDFLREKLSLFMLSGWSTVSVQFCLWCIQVYWPEYWYH